MKLGNKKDLNEEDLYEPVVYEKTKYLTDQLETEWNKELKKPKSSLIRVIVRVYGLRVLTGSLIYELYVNLTRLYSA